jgi:putative endonuclease
LVKEYIPRYPPAGRQGSVIKSSMYFVYILQSEMKNHFYTGLTKDLTRRLQEHNSGQVKPTKAYAPFRIVHTEEFKTLLEARSREKFFKTGTGRKLRSKILNIPR